MPRRPRACPGGYIYHVWNRGAGRLRLFKKDGDFAAFNRTLVEAHAKHPIRIIDWCLMPDHWHFVVYPESDGQVTAFFRWLTHAHAMRAITHRRVLGLGPLYQGRFRSLPVERGEWLERVLRHVLRNPVRADLVPNPLHWPWTGSHARRFGDDALRGVLAPWPMRMPTDWSAWVHAPQPDAELQTLREHIRRNRPYGSPMWVRNTAEQLGLLWTLRPRGRPTGSRGQ